MKFLELIVLRMKAPMEIEPDRPNVMQCLGYYLAGRFPEERNMEAAARSVSYRRTLTTARISMWSSPVELGVSYVCECCLWHI